MSLSSKLKDLLGEIKGRQLTRTDRLLLDILSEMVDILTSSDSKEKLKKNTKRRTSNTSNTSNLGERDEQNVLSLSDFLRSRNNRD